MLMRCSGFARTAPTAGSISFRFADTLLTRSMSQAKAVAKWAKGIIAIKTLREEPAKSCLGLVPAIMSTPDMVTLKTALHPLVWCRWKDTCRRKVQVVTEVNFAA